MNGEVGKGESEIDVDDDIELTDDSEEAVVSEDIAEGDNVGDVSVEINVEELVAKIEESDNPEDPKKEIHRRLEELNDQREADREFDSTYNFNLDDDL